MWDERYRISEYIYGKEPNTFFSSELSKLSVGKILLPGEGEGRNAVFAAQMGWNVHAFDASIEGKKKALRLADEKNVSIRYDLLKYDEFDVTESSYDAIGLFYTHQAPSERKAFHRRILKALKQNGVLILEGFSKKQLQNMSGGPKNPDYLLSVQELEEDFGEMEIQMLHELTRELSEGSSHRGIADLVQLVARK